MKTYLFQHETAADAPGEKETLDPIAIEADDRDHADLYIGIVVRDRGGMTVRCPSCTDAPLVVGEKICRDCVGVS